MRRITHQKLVQQPHRRKTESMRRITSLKFVQLPDRRKTESMRRITSLKLLNYLIEKPQRA